MGHGHDSFTAYRPYDFVAANKNYVENTFSEPDQPVGAKSRVGIITCCDARCSPEHFFELGPNEAFVIRNGGGRTATSDVIRTIYIIEVISEIKELKVIHHTDCGALVYTDEFLRNMVAQNDPKSMSNGAFRDGAHTWAEAVSSLPFSQRDGESDRQRVERSVIEDVLYLRNHPLIKATIPVTGYVYDLHTGAVVEVNCGLENGLQASTV